MLSKLYTNLYVTQLCPYLLSLLYNTLRYNKLYPLSLYPYNLYFTLLNLYINLAFTFTYPCLPLPYSFNPYYILALLCPLLYTFTLSTNFLHIPLSLLLTLSTNFTYPLFTFISLNSLYLTVYLVITFISLYLTLTLLYFIFIPLSLHYAYFTLILFTLPYSYTFYI